MGDFWLCVKYISFSVFGKGVALLVWGEGVCVGGGGHMYNRFPQVSSGPGRRAEKRSKTLVFRGEG